MGDILSLVEQAERNIDREQAEKMANKLKKGKGFNLEDFRDQVQQMRKMGGMASLLDKLPGMADVPDQVKGQLSDKEFVRIEAIINSMTPKERRFPDLIKGSRKRRIAAGSGTQVQDVNKLLKQFDQMQRMMKKMSKGGLGKLMRGLGGKFPGGTPF
jgi:signal recognition particle subunit SRP54